MVDEKVKTVEVPAEKVPLASGGLESPTIYADSIRGMFVAGGVAKLNLIENRVDAVTEELTNIIVATVVLPESQLRLWGEFLIRNADRLRDASASGGEGAEA